jgi:hypothetical protein
MSDFTGEQTSGRRRVKRVVETVLVAALALAAVGFGIWGVGMGSGEIDPFLKFGAGDEVVYGHAAARMVSTGHWATSIYLDRLLLNKPPLLMWLGALAMHLFGVSPFVLRLPVVLAGAFCCGLLYLWMRRMKQPVTAAFIALILLAGDPFFHVMARKFMTDILLTLWITLAVFVLAGDFRLSKTWTAYAYGALTGAAIMTKSAAGLIPLLILIAFWLLAGKEDRPPIRRVLIAFGTAVLVAAPWHIYEFATHREWFLTEYLNVQILGMGVTTPAITEGGPKLWFYLRGLLLTDPVLAILSLAALPGLAMAWFREDRALARLLTAWIVVMIVCLAAFANRASYYALPLIPALALLSARYISYSRGAWAVCAVLVALFAVKVSAPDRLWGLDFRQGTTLRSAPELDAYNRLQRTNELVVVAPDDEFYSSVIGLPKVRYAWVSPSVDYSKTPNFFYWLGVIVSPDEFCQEGPAARPPALRLHIQRLKAWHAPPVTGTVVMARADAEIADMIRCSPDRDFFLPDNMDTMADAAHHLVRFGSGRFFLLANKSGQSPAFSGERGRWKLD